IVTGLEAGHGSGNIDKTPTIPHDSPLPRVRTLGSDEGRMHDKCRIHISVCMDKSKITRKQSKTSKHGHENQKSTKPKPEKSSLNQNQPRKVKDS
ncbi:hypothetical protein Tco_1242515, partial [Tanacetum coccineum]